MSRALLSCISTIIPKCFQDHRMLLHFQYITPHIALIFVMSIKSNIWITCSLKMTFGFLCWTSANHVCRFTTMLSCMLDLKTTLTESNALQWGQLYFYYDKTLWKGSIVFSKIVFDVEGSTVPVKKYTGIINRYRFVTCISDGMFPGKWLIQAPDNIYYLRGDSRIPCGTVRNFFKQTREICMKVIKQKMKIYLETVSLL